VGVVKDYYGVWSLGVVKDYYGVCSCCDADGGH
jgi:hypothetical protein